MQNNPRRKAGGMGKNKADKMKFWTKDEFYKFIDSIMGKQKSYAAFMTLFWTGMRLGELLALTPADIDFENKTISISKSYQRLDGKDVITLPKTPKSKRTITVPDFLLADLKDYMNSIYCLEDTDRLFQVTKYFMEHEMQRGIKNSGVKRIRIHDIRHPYVKLKLKLSSVYFRRIFSTKILDFPLYFKSVVGINAHLFDKHICECLC